MLSILSCLDDVSFLHWNAFASFVLYPELRACGWNKTIQNIVFSALYPSPNGSMNSAFAFCKLKLI